MLKKLIQLKWQKPTKMKKIQQIFTNNDNNEETVTAKLAELEKITDPQYRYIIAITPRSGSSYLSDVIVNTKKLGNPSEFMNEQVIPDVLKNIPSRNPDEYLRNVLRFKKTTNNVAGLKASWFQFNNFMDCVTNKTTLLEFKYIHLIRRDVIAQAVSLYRATASTVFHSNIKHSDEAINKLNTLEYDYDKIQEWYFHILKQEQGWQKFFDENNIFPLNIFYEEIEEDIISVLKRIARYIGIDENIIRLPNTGSVFKKISDTRSLEWTHRFSLENTLYNQQPIITNEQQSIFDIDYQNSEKIDSKITNLFTYHHFKPLNLPKSPIISTLEKNSLVVKQAFISAVSFNTDKTLFGGIYQNNQLISKATYRGIALYTQKDALTITDTIVNNGRFIKGQCVYLGWLWDYPSHALFESLSHFWILNNIDIKNTNFIFHPIGSNFDLTSVFNTELTKHIFDCFNIKLEQIILADVNLVVEELIIPTPLFLINLSADRFQQSLYQRLKIYLLQLATPISTELNIKLYLTANDKTVNSIISTILNHHGFKIINLKETSVCEQVKLVSQASIIITDNSSAYLSIFAAKRAKVIIFENNISSNQLIINALSNTETHFVASHLLTDEVALKCFLVEQQIIPEKSIENHTFSQISLDLINLTEQEKQWLLYFKNLCATNALPAIHSIEAKPPVIDKNLRFILTAMQQNKFDVVLNKIEELDENSLNTPEANTAKRWLVAQAILNKNIDLAKQLYQPILMQQPINQALILPNLTELDLKDAIVNYPDWTELSLILGYFYWVRGLYSHASKTVSTIIDKSKENIVYYTAVEIYCDSLIRAQDPKDLLLVESLCKKVLPTQTNKCYPPFYLGAVFFKRYLIDTSKENLDKALMYFNQAKTRPQGLSYNSQGCSSVLDPNKVPLVTVATNKEFINPIIFDKDNKYLSSPQAILFFACDAIYFRKYAFLLMASLVRFNEQTVYHIHIVNPTYDIADFILKLRRQFNVLQLNISFEFVNLKHQKAYYASVRFIRAQQLLVLYQSPLLIIDVDLIMNTPISHIANFVGSKDVGLLLHNRTAILPWVAVQACVVYLNNTEKTQQFLELLANVLLARLFDNNEETLWFIDQNALFSVVRFMEEKLSVCNLLDITPRVYDIPKGMNKRSFTRMKLAEFGFNDSFINSLIE